MTKAKWFPDSTINTVHQNGQALSDPHKGVTVILHFRDGEMLPVCAEVFGGDEHAEVGLEWDGNLELYGFDGVFEIPNEVLETLREHGFKISPDL